MTGLAPEWVSVFGRVNHLGTELKPPSVAGWNEYPAKTGEGSKQAHRVIHHPYPWSRSVVLVPG